MPTIRNEFSATEEQRMRQQRRADNDQDAAAVRKPNTRGYDRNAIMPENVMNFPHTQDDI